MPKLYIGCAEPPFHQQHYDMFPDLNEFIWVDKYVTHPNIKNWDAKDLQVEDDSVEVIYASHLLEHIEHTQIEEILNHWKRKLKTGGQIVINVPDLEWTARQIINWEKGYLLNGYYSTFTGNNGLLTILYGTQAHDGEYHKSGFTKRSLEELGFEVEKMFDAHDMGVLIAKWQK